MLSSNLKSLAPLGCAALLLLACTEGAESGAATSDAADAADSDTKTGAAAADSNWVRTVGETEAGGYLMGNPDAPVKLIEYASLTCSHCRDFHETAMSELKGKYIATGKVSYELRNFFLNPADIAATLLARCSTPEAYFALTDAFFSQQSQWMQPFTELGEAQLKPLESLPPNEAMARYAKLGGLDQFVRARGIPPSKADACLTDEAELKQLDALRRMGLEQHSVEGTPSFVVDGEPVTFTGWPALKAKLDAAI